MPTINSRRNETFSKLQTLNNIVLMTSSVTFIAISHTRPHTHTYSRIHHTLRDTHLFFLIKEIALLCWLFYLKPWLPLCAPDHAVTETRRRAAGLIGAWDARVVQQGRVAKEGSLLMVLHVCGSPLSPLSVRGTPASCMNVGCDVWRCMSSMDGNCDVWNHPIWT